MPELANALHAHLLHCAMTTAPRRAAGKKRSKGKRGAAQPAVDTAAEEESTDTAAETPASWEAIAVGLAALLGGMGDKAATSQLPWATEEGSVTALLQRAATPAATQASRKRKKVSA